MVSKGEALFGRGDGPDGCYWLRHGFVKISVASRLGRERILAVLGPDTTLGEPALFEELPRAVSAHALTDCQVAVIDRRIFSQLLRDRPEVYRHLVRAVTRELRQVAEEAVVVGFLSPRGRVAHAMLQLAATIGRRLPDGRSEIRYTLPHGELASMALVSRESVARYFGEWRRRKLLHLSPDNRFVLDQATFEEALAEEWRPPPP